MKCGDAGERETEGGGERETEGGGESETEGGAESETETEGGSDTESKQACLPLSMIPTCSPGSRLHDSDVMSEGERGRNSAPGFARLRAFGPPALSPAARVWWWCGIGSHQHKHSRAGRSS